MKGAVAFFSPCMIFTSAVSASGGVASYTWQATGQGADQLTYRASLNGGAEFDGECVNVCPLLFQNDLSHSSPASSPYELDLTGLAAGTYTLHVKAILNGQVVQEFDLSYLLFKLSGSGE